MATDPSTLVTFQHVKVLARSGLSITCDINGQTVTLRSAMVELPSTILHWHPTDGTLVIAQGRAQQLGLLDGATQR